jgi:hypothetical protein
MTAKESLEHILSTVDERQAADILMRLRPRPSELLTLEKAEREFWLALFPMETDLSEFSEWMKALPRISR